MIQGKKASIEPFPVLVGVMGATILLAMVSMLLEDYGELKRLNPEPLGGKAVELLQAYQEADEALLYLDRAAALSMPSAIRESAYNGGCPPRMRQICGSVSINDYVKYTDGSTAGDWSDPEGKCVPRARPITTCIPIDTHILSGLYSQFNTELNSYVDAFNDKNANDASDVMLRRITGDNYDLNLSSFFGKLEMIGIAKKPIVVSGENFEYKTLPSFRALAESSLVSDFYEIKSRIEEFLSQGNDALMGLSESDLNYTLNSWNDAEGYLFWNLITFTKDQTRNECKQIDCTYEVCRTVNDCKDHQGVERYYYHTTTAEISVNRKDDESYVYRFALNWMSGESKEDCGPKRRITTVIETNKGIIEVELNPDAAPITVTNFLQYVNSGHYDGTIFHRVITGFLIQGGGFVSDGSEKPTLAPIKSEAINGLKNKIGTISMARTQDPDSATSQFFINVADNSFLDEGPGNPGYTVFGKVIKGMEVVREIESVPTATLNLQENWPTENVIIEKAYVKPD